MKLLKQKSIVVHMNDTRSTLPKEKPKRKWFSFLKRNKN
jgi:hypothetical protein